VGRGPLGHRSSGSIVERFPPAHADGQALHEHPP
jgi:hypothetical protein